MGNQTPCAACRKLVDSPLWHWVPFHGERLLPNPYRQQNPSRGFGAVSPWRDPGVSITWPEVQAWLEADETRTCSLTIARELADLEKTWGAGRRAAR